jgi:hypothetical protein
MIEDFLDEYDKFEEYLGDVPDGKKIDYKKNDPIEGFCTVEGT